MSKNNISFILHEPQLSENIGACARAIKNFDFRVSTTQQLIISLIVPKSSTNSSENDTKEKEEISGCVSAITGFRL